MMVKPKKTACIKQYLTHAAIMLTASCSSAFAAPALPESPYNKYYAPPAKSIQLIADQRFTYDSNPLKLANNVESLMGSETTAKMLLNSRTPSSLLRSDTTISKNVYDNNEFDAVNFHETLTFSHSTDNWNGSIIGQYDYDTARTSEITSFGINVPLVRHTQFSVSPELRYIASTDNTYAINGNWVKSNYDIASFVGYSMYSIVPSWQHRLTTIHSAIVNMTYSNFKTETGIPIVTTTLGPSIGVLTEWSPSLQSRFTAGYEESEQENESTNVTTDQSNYVFSGSLTYVTDQHNTAVFASRSQRPTANGVTGLNTSLRITEDYKLSPRITLNGMVRALDMRYIGDPGVNLDTEVAGGGGIRYKLLDTLDLSCNYQYINQELTGNFGTVKAHMVMVGFNLHPFAWGL